MYTKQITISSEDMIQVFKSQGTFEQLKEIFDAVAANYYSIDILLELTSYLVERSYQEFIKDNFNSTVPLPENLNPLLLRSHEEDMETAKKDTESYEEHECQAADKYVKKTTIKYGHNALHHAFYAGYDYAQSLKEDVEELTLKQLLQQAINEL